MADISAFNRIVPAVNQVETHMFWQQYYLHDWMEKYNIRTNAIVTGNILTDAMRNEIAYYSKRDGTSFEDSLAELKAGTVLNEIGRPEDTAETMAFLASPAAAFFNGCFFAVDGRDTCGTVY